MTQLFAGLAGFGISLAIMVRADLGLGPWDVLHQGLAELTGVAIGSVVIAVSLLVLALWIPLRQGPGFGTLANAVVVGLAVNATLAVLARPSSLGIRALFLVAAIVANGAATGMYIGAGLGPGPRDGLMTGLAQRGYSIRWVRTLIEVSVLGLGLALGGGVGVGTILYAFSIGFLAHYFIPKFAIDAVKDGARPAPARSNKRMLRGLGSPGNLSAKRDIPGVLVAETTAGDGGDQCCSV